MEQHTSKTGNKKWMFCMIFLVFLIWHYKRMDKLRTNQRLPTCKMKKIDFKSSCFDVKFHVQGI
jgi:hypothetical protein